MRLSQNFTLAEFEFSETAIRHGIDNTVPKRFIPNLERLCEFILEPVRKKFGTIRITSGYRCIPLNRLLKSKDTSHHTSGHAADIVIASHRPLVVCDWIYGAELPYEQVIHEFGRWCHAAVAPENHKPSRTLLTIDNFGTRPGLHEPRETIHG